MRLYELAKYGSDGDDLSVAQMQVVKHHVWNEKDAQHWGKLRADPDFPLHVTFRWKEAKADHIEVAGRLIGATFFASLQTTF